MGIVGAFYLLFIAVPAGLAFLLGAVFARNPFLAGIGSVAVLALWLLVENASYGIIATLPFVGLVSAMAAIPAILAAFIGSRIRLSLDKET